MGEAWFLWDMFNTHKQKFNHMIPLHIDVVGLEMKLKDAYVEARNPNE